VVVTERTQVVLAGAIGNIVEWYDFGLYGLLAPVLASLFFPAHDRIAALLGVYGGFAVGFAMRPIGAVVLGRVGDRHGRQFVLVLSVALIGAATVAIGMLPSYRAIGVWAPILLIGIRLFQGFSVGGEFVGSVTYLVETAPAKRRGITGSVANIGATVGMLLAAGAAALTQAYSAFSSELWRVPFLFGGLLALAGYLLRRHLPREEPQVEHTIARTTSTSETSHSRARASGSGRFASLIARWPAFDAFRKVPRTMIITTLFCCGYGVSNYLTMVFLPTFGREFANVSEGSALKINVAGQALALVLVPIAGWISDRWLLRRTVLAAAFLLQAAVAWESFRLVQHAGAEGLWAAQMLLAALLSMVMGVAPAMLAEQFPRGYRVSAHAFALNIGIGIAGGSAPLIAVALIRATTNRMAPAAYLTGACVIAGIAVLLLRDRSRQVLEENRLPALGNS
jgi:MFS transporter, MHS family, proline/betaine transporter